MAVDVTKWLTENLNALNLPAEDQAAAQRLLTGALGQRLGQSLYRQEDVSALQSALDRQRNEAAAERAQLEQWNLSWQDRYEQDLLAVGAIDRLAAAGFDVSGYTNTGGGGVVNQRTGEQFTPQQVAAMLEQQKQEIMQSIEPMRTGLADWATFVADVSPDYRDTYGKKFDAKKFRQFAFENRQDYPSLQSAYDAFTADDRKAKEEADRKKWEEDKTKEIEQNVFARLQLPEIGPGNAAEGSPFHTLVDNAKTDQQPSRAENRQEFAKKFRNVDFTIGS